MGNRIIVYEKLNFITFCFSLIIKPFFQKQYFITFSPFLKKYFSSIIKKAGIEQIHFLDFLGAGIQGKTSKMTIEVSNKIIEDNPEYAEPFVRFMNDQRARDVVKKVFSYRLRDEMYKYVVLKEFITNHSNSIIYYCPYGKKGLVDHIKEVSSNVTILKWHYMISNIFNYIKNITLICFLLVFPFYLFLRFLKDGNITLRKSNHKITKNVVCFHVNYDLNVAHAFRDMYMFNSGVFKIGDCVHTCLIRPLSIDKANYLRKNGGTVYDYHQVKICLMQIFKRLFVDYYKIFFISLCILSLDEFSSFLILRDILGIIYHTIKIKGFLKNIHAKIAFFENAHSLIPSIFTILANKYNIKTITMLHGIGGYCFPESGLAWSVINYFLVPGYFFDKYIQPINPYVENFCAVGNHEIEGFSYKDISNIAHLKKHDKKIITILASYYWPFFPSYQLWPLFYDEMAKKAFLKYWLPFFKWIGKQEDLFIVFKGKSAAKQYDHPYLREAMSYLSKENYYQDDSLLMRDVINISDCTITDGGSAFYSTLCLGVPSIAYEVACYPPGDLPGEEYSRYIVARKPDELINNLIYILKNGLPESLYINIRKDHHAEGKLDGQTSLRIKGLINEIIEGE